MLAKQMTVDQMREYHGTIAAEVKKLFLAKGWPSMADRVPYCAADIAKKKYPLQAVVVGLKNMHEMDTPNSDIIHMHRAIRETLGTANNTAGPIYANCAHCGDTGLVSFFEPATPRQACAACKCSEGVARANGMGLVQWPGTWPWIVNGVARIAHKDYISGKHETTAQDAEQVSSLDAGGGNG
jgi:hypothetical protein